MREWCRSGRGGGGGVVVLGHEGGSSTRAEGSEVERVDKMWRTPERLDVGAWCQRAVGATKSALVQSLP